jgi:hypothetical protein
MENGEHRAFSRDLMIGPQLPGAAGSGTRQPINSGHPGDREELVHAGERAEEVKRRVDV